MGRVHSRRTPQPARSLRSPVHNRYAAAAPLYDAGIAEGAQSVRGDPIAMRSGPNRFVTPTTGRDCERRGEKR